MFPLTGLPANGSSNVQRPALSVKLDNAPDALPQAGLGAADVVTEELVEGNLTRLFVTFQSHDADLVGPIRSARPVDAELLRQFGGGIFAYSGAAAGEIAPAKDHGHATLIAFDNDPTPFRRLAGRSVPHNIFASTARLYDAGRQSGAAWHPPASFLQRSDAPSVGTAMTVAALPMSPTTSVTWTWNPTIGRFTRTQNGRPVISTGEGVVATTNVVVLSVQIGSTGIFDARHNEDPLVVALGSGPAWVMSGGQVRQGTWRRASNNVALEVTDASGAALAIRPGQSWVELLPAGRAPTFS